MPRFAWMLLISALFALAGCAADGPPQSADNIDPAQVKFEKAEDPPLEPNTYYAAGRLSETQNRYANAVKQYQQALKLDPRHLPSLYRLGVVYTHLQQYDKAIADWRLYIAAAKDAATGYANLGLTQELAGQTAAAEESFNKGIAADPKNQPCRVNYGLMLARLGRADDALAQFSAVLTPAQAHYNLGSVYEQQKKFDKAREQYEAALKLNPKFTDARMRLEKLP